MVRGTQWLGVIAAVSAGTGAGSLLSEPASKVEGQPPSRGGAQLTQCVVESGASQQEAVGHNNAVVETAEEAREPAEADITELYQNMATYLTGELTATSEDYKLLENMNKLTSLKYLEMKDIAVNISRNLKDLNQKYAALQPYLDQITLIEEQVAPLEQAAYKLDAYSKKLEAKYKKLEVMNASPAQRRTPGMTVRGYQAGTL
ncbi:biogenesis of lysosome-related organelles complex 1 subunit 2-like [Dromiciops gliroides]|uniref:biogenesis of lysosome-related organelles complex 1 subunit 2-like n=1 Tax=Dromiciops gliroides TaxID=33562 RepID=UPI001CC537CD|nr:biogenesis of lysosome-related organelles complex 1 subunit 2-like [Dromiciops gliroides]